MTFKWSHKLPVSWASSIFRLLCLSILDLGSGARQTDGQTDDDHRILMPPPYVGGGIVRDAILCQSELTSTLRNPVTLSFGLGHRTIAVTGRANVKLCG